MENEIIIYQPDETMKLDVRFENETVWLTQEQMRDKIIHERRVELAFEGHRWFDMIRYPNNYALNFLHSIGKTAATTKHLLFPIPMQEREANELLTQNPGY